MLSELIKKKSAVAFRKSGKEDDEQLNAVDIDIEESVTRELFFVPSFAVNTFINGVTSVAISKTLIALRCQAVGSEKIPILSPKTYLMNAKRLVSLFGAVAARVDDILSAENVVAARDAINARVIENEQKIQLSCVRSGLEQTAQRVRLLEDKLTHAVIATVGIERQLNQAQARAQRGHIISTIITYYDMFTQFKTSDLQRILGSLAKAREQVRNQLREIIVTSHRVLGSGDFEFYRDIREDADSAKLFGQLGDEERTAISRGLRPLFACRRFTQSCVWWVAKLIPVARGLQDLFPAASGNAEIYYAWLQSELLLDTFALSRWVMEIHDTRTNELNPSLELQSCERALFQELKNVCERFSVLTGGDGADLVGAFAEQAAKQLDAFVSEKLALSPLPQVPPLTTPSSLSLCDFFRTTTRPEIYRYFEYNRHRIRLTLTLLRCVAASANSSNASTVMRQFFVIFINRVFRLFIHRALTAAYSVADSLVKQEAHLSPRSVRKVSRRVVDAIGYSLTITAELLMTARGYIDSIDTLMPLPADGEFLRIILLQCFDPFPTRYTAQREEPRWLRRAFGSMALQYTRDLQPLSDQFYGYRPAHTARLKEMLACVRDSLGRARQICDPADLRFYTEEILLVVLDGFSEFLTFETRKGIESVAADAPHWRRASLLITDLDHGLAEASMESHLCAIDLLVFVESALASLSSTLSTVLDTGLAQQYPDFVEWLEARKGERFASLNEAAEQLLNLILHAIVVRSLTVLERMQGARDYCLGGGKSSSSNRARKLYAAEAFQTTIECTHACSTFCAYLALQLNRAAPFIRLSRDTSFEPSNVGNTDVRTERATPVATSLSRGADKLDEQIIAGSASTTIQNMTLHDMLYPEVPSFARLIGVALYRGLSAHFRGFSVSPEGALVYKKDVTLIRTTLQPLVSTAGEDGVVVGILFDLLRETSNLLLIPFEELETAKNRGLIMLLIEEEKNLYIAMRTSTNTNK